MIDPANSADAKIMVERVILLTSQFATVSITERPGQRPDHPIVIYDPVQIVVRSIAGAPLACHEGVGQVV